MGARLSYLTAFRIVVETFRNRPRIVVRRFVGAVPDVFCLVWFCFRLKFGSNSKIPGRILKCVQFFSSAESNAERCEMRYHVVFKVGCGRVRHALHRGPSNAVLVVLFWGG